MIGCGAPPVLTPQGWLVVYSRCQRKITEFVAGLRLLRYSVGVMVLSRRRTR